MTLAEILAEAERLDEAATKGPWRGVEGYPSGSVHGISGGDNNRKVVVFGGIARSMSAEGQANAAFIAFARTALPRLVAVAEAAMEWDAADGTHGKAIGNRRSMTAPRAADARIALRAALRGEP